MPWSSMVRSTPLRRTTRSGPSCESYRDAFTRAMTKRIDVDRKAAGSPGTNVPLLARLDATVI